MTHQRPNVDGVLSQLKDFQRDTAEYVFDRLYGPDATRRFLLADEVGLGKTLVAKGVITKAIDHMWDSVPRIDVIYICSNADIARQNLTRLHPARDGFTLPSRVTLLPLNAAELSENKLNFISFTPGTSFETKSAMGTAEERALLLRLLRDDWSMGRRKGPRKLFQGTCRTLDSFDWTLAWVDGRAMSDELQSAFLLEVGRRPQLKAAFDSLVDRYTFARDLSSLPDEVRYARRDLIGELRHVLARTCIRALQPDLVVLDEFQRFKHLLAGEDDAAELARELFDWQDEDSDARARVLLMSATPYKMYTLNGEDVDDHYRDFVATLDFLLGSEEAERVGVDLAELRREILRYDPATDAGALEGLHAQIEAALRRVIVRTERVGSTPDANAMLRTVHERTGAPTETDVRDYLALQEVSRVVGQPDVLEFWKSSPYLLNLMGDGYKLVRSVKAGLASAGVRRQLAMAIPRTRTLDPEDVRRWRDLDAGGARMRALVEDTVGSGAWQLLWVPPSLPTYRLAGAYAGRESMTKRLVFSSWAVVPRAIASLVSYAAEAELWRTLDPAASNTPETRNSRRGRLAFALTDDRLTGMPVLALLYPCSELAQVCDPLSFAQPDGLPTLTEVRVSARERVSKLAAPHLEGAPATGAEDEAWYWALPLLLDAAGQGQDATAWLRAGDAVSAWSGDNQADGRWVDHVRRAQSLAAGGFGLGRPPEDLVAVVTDLGLFGWGTSALRALQLVADPGVAGDALRRGSARVAWGLRSLFNLPEVNAFVSAAQEDQPYWRQCLSYSAAGGLQAVLDEYAHLLVEALGHASGTSTAIDDVSQRMAAAVTLRTAQVGAEHVAVDPEEPSVTFSPLNLRARFATRFGESTSDEGAEVTRPDALRAAFNSPFWPFVLASTSVGQEGLDFHHYCHAIVHWNLPPNPVDLEQREGRIHRYKNHAVRRNLASRYAGEVLGAQAVDPWSELFALARARRDSEECDLVPYWLFSDGPARIERRVPMLPLSREVERFDRLRQSLAVYRMAFGQSRQEDLVAYLLDRFDREQIDDLLGRLRIDLRPTQQSIATV